MMPSGRYGKKLNMLIILHYILLSGLIFSCGKYKFYKEGVVANHPFHFGYKHLYFFIDLISNTRLYLGFSAKPQIQQVSTCKIGSRSGNIILTSYPITSMSLDHFPDIQTQTRLLCLDHACRMCCRIVWKISGSIFLPKEQYL